MHRRDFLQLAAVAAARAGTNETPKYRVVTNYQPAAEPGMPGPYPGQVVRVHADKSIDEKTRRVDVPTVRAMISQGIRSLTGANSDRDAWSHFVSSNDIVGIKLNCSGAPVFSVTDRVSITLPVRSVTSIWASL